MFERRLAQEVHGGTGVELVSHLMFGSYLASFTCTLLSPPADIRSVKLVETDVGVARSKDVIFSLT